MSEVIEDYIRRHPGRTEADAFEGFVGQDRIRAWVGTDAQRRDRLRTEFGRVWQTLQGAAGGTRGPVSMHETDLEIEAARKAAEAKRAQKVPVHVAPSAAASARKLDLMCTVCGKTTVFQSGPSISCRTCGHAFGNLLELVPVKPVGPFAFLFGEGLAGWATAGGMALLLVGIYGVLRWV